MRVLGWGVSLACVLVLVAGSAAAQGSISEIEAEVVSEPEDVLGTYEVALTVETSQSRPVPACVCSESILSLLLAPELEWVEASFEPEEYRINWFEKAQRGDAGTHVEEVRLSVRVGEEKTGDDPVVVLVDGLVRSNGPQDDRVVPELLTLEIPGGKQGGSEDAVRPAGGSGSGGDDARTEEASIVPAAPLAGIVLTLGVVAAWGRMGSR